MTVRSLGKFVPPPGPLLSLSLIGLVLLSGLLYYRSVKIQRFLEPALALTQPRNEFARDVSELFIKEFGARAVPGFKVKSSSILMDKSLIFSSHGALYAPKSDLQKIARIFLALMKDTRTRADISLVLIIGHFPVTGVNEAIDGERMKIQRITGSIQDALFRLEPELGTQYAAYFASAAQLSHPGEGMENIVEFRIIPSEFLHIKVLEKLEKYSL